MKRTTSHFIFVSIFVTCTYVYLTLNTLICMYRLLSTLQVWLWLDAKLHYVAFTLALLAIIIKLNLIQYFDSTLVQMWMLLKFKGKKKMDKMGADPILYIPLCDAIGNYQFQSIFDNHDSKVWSASTACKRDPSVLWLLFLPCQKLLFFPLSFSCLTLT